MNTSVATPRSLQRIEERRPRYRRAGFWSADPVDVVRDAARAAPGAVAVVERTPRGGGDASMTYAELDAAVDRAATALAERGVSPGDRVLIAASNDSGSVIAIHAVLRIDAVVLLVPPGVGAAQLVEIVGSTGPKLVVAAPEWADAQSVAGTQTVSAGELTDGVGDVRSPRPARAADEPSFVLFTSGTTSKPKGVVHSISTLHKASANYVEAAGLTGEDVIFLISPLSSVTGALQAAFVAPTLRIPVVLENKWDPAATFDLLTSSRSTWYGGPDRLLDRLLDQVRPGGPTPSLRAVYLGGTMLDDRIVERVERDFGIVVMRAYGSSEVPISTSGLRGDPASLRHHDDADPMTDVDVRIGSDLDPGELCITGPHAFVGYTDPEDDAHAYDGEWYVTGDVATYENGRIRIVGRLRDVVIRNGLKIPIAEVERALGVIDGVRDSAGYVVADDTTGERLAVAVQCDPGLDVDIAGIRDTLVHNGLAKFKVPEEIVLWDGVFPTNANGKVDRAKLGELGSAFPRRLASRLTGG